MCKRPDYLILLVLAAVHSYAVADELVGLSDVTVEGGELVSLQYESKAYVVAEGDLLLGTTTRWYVTNGTENLWVEGDPTPAATVNGTSTVKAGDVGSKADNFNFNNGGTNISSIDGIDFQETVFPFLSNIFFLFERGGNDQGTWQAINADGSLGTPVQFTASNVYGNTGVNVGGQNAFGVVFITDKPVMGVRVTASGHDTLSISAPVPVPVLAVFPTPEDGAVDVERDSVLSWTPGIFAQTHNVYLGQSWEDVNNASLAAPLQTEAIGGLDVNSLEPSRFEFGTTYYWRVDEVNGTPDRTVYRGNVWSFETEPYSYLLPGSAISATASSEAPSGVSSPDKTIDGSGLEGDTHDTSPETMWFTATVDMDPWIQYEFDDLKKLDVMKVWNSNAMAEGSIGWGVKSVEIAHSVDGETWTVLEDVNELSRAPGNKAYDQFDTVDFNGAAARYVRLTIGSNWGGILMSYSLSEVQFYTIPAVARTPVPESGSVDVPVDAMVKWRAGRGAGEHILYVGIDVNAVADGTADSVTTATNTYDLGLLNLELDETYYWRVDEVNDAEVPSVWAGPVWNLSTPVYVTVDDFEGYGNDSPDRPFQTWLDGFGYSADDFFPVAYGGNGSGSGVGHDIWSLSSAYYGGSIMEQDTTISGSTQSLPLYYTNGGVTDRIWTVPQDWTLGGAKTLVVHFYGDPENTGQLYVQVNNGTKVMYDGSATALATPYWTQWNIDLASMGNVQNVSQLSIGLEGGSGLVYIDDIRLYRDAPASAGEQIWIEAESAQITAPLQVYSDKDDASGGSYIGTDDLGNLGNQSEGIASFTFTVQGGTYKVNALVIAADAGDSFWIRLPGSTMNTTPPADNNGWIRYNGIPHGDTWHWDDVHNDQDGSVAVEFTLPAGTHTLEIGYREDGALLDAIVITDQL